MSLEAFKASVLPASDKMFRFANRLVGEVEEARDIVQEVLIRVWNKRDIIHTLDNTEAWCMQITKNLCYDKLKSKAYRANISMDNDWPIEDTAETPHGQVEKKEMLNRIKESINGLPDKQRAVMQLRDIEGYSYNEISEILEMDLNQVKVNLFRARQSVRKDLTKINTYGLKAD